MTTISPKRKRRGARVQLITLIAIILACVGIVFLLRSSLSSVLWRVGVPVSELSSGVSFGMGNFFSSFYTNHSLTVENARLRAELASTAVMLLDRHMLYAENLELKSSLGRVTPQSPQTLASVVLRPPGTPYDTLIIDIGKKQGVEVGDIVAAGGSVYIGTVEEVYAAASRVVLFSAPGKTYQALLLERLGATPLAISVAGQGSGSLMAEVPAGISVGVGDEVALSSITPKLIAKVVAIEEKNQASFKTIFMQLPVNIHTLRFVQVYHQDISLHAQ